MKMPLKHVQIVRSKGHTYYYHRPSRTRIQAEFGSADFAAEVERLNKRIAAQVVPKAGTLGGLIAAYRGAPEFTQLAPRTRVDYQKVFDYLQRLDAMPLVEIDTPFLVALRDRTYRKHKRRFANYLIDVLSILFNFGKPRKLTAANPAADVPAIRKPHGGRPVNRAWTPAEFTMVMEAMPPELRVAVALGAYAGLREGDMLTLPWSAYDGATLQSRQAKTGDPIWVPAHRDLRMLLDAAPRRSPIIVVGARGRPFTESGFRARFFKVIRALVAAGRVEPGLTYHGLRHTAATMLADAGCDTRDIMAVTGHRTESMVAGYTRTADRKRRATAAIARLESAAQEQQPNGKCKTGL